CTGSACNGCHDSVDGDPADGVIAEVGDVEILILIADNAVRQIELGRIRRAVRGTNNAHSAGKRSDLSVLDSSDHAVVPIGDVEGAGSAAQRHAGGKQELPG